MNQINPINYREKIIALSTVFLLGTLFHTELVLMFLFHPYHLLVAVWNELLLKPRNHF